ncbi:MAG: hypothetical protein JKY45_10965 [Emcibacter sp.]|nr:hypothetical protein [Emcibacter sp.]
MKLYLSQSETYKPETYITGHFHSGFLACVIAFLIATSTPTPCHAINLQPIKTPHDKRNSLTLFKSHRNLSLAYGQDFLLSGNIYAVKKHDFLSSFAPTLEFNKRHSITDLGVTGIIKWPMIQEKSWSLLLNGKVSGSHHYPHSRHQRNRWNFEHQIGWDANYQFANSLQASVGIYHYRIINHFQYDNPTRSYIKSNAGFARLRLSF